MGGIFIILKTAIQQHYLLSNQHFPWCGTACLLDLSALFWFPGLIDGSNAICDWFFCCGGPSLTNARIWLASYELVVRVVVSTTGIL